MAAAAWQTFLTHSLASRLEPEKFESFVQILESKNRLSPDYISDIFLRPTKSNGEAPDPRVARYVQVLLGLGFVTVPSVLRGLLRYSSASSTGVNDAQNVENTADQAVEKECEKGEQAGKKKWRNSYATEEMLFYRLAKSIATGTAPKDIQEASKLLLILIQWMETTLSAYHAARGMLELGGGHMEELHGMIMALGTLVIAAVENQRVLEVIAKGRGKELSKVLSSFVPILLQSPQNADRLELFRTQTLVALSPQVEKGEKRDMSANKEIDEMLEGGMGLSVDGMVVEEVPGVNSRAGLYIYLNSLLVGRPLIDDSAIFAYLHARYQGDTQSTIVNLILASFDILADATSRNERAPMISLLRSFLINKIPLLLSTLSATLYSPPLSSESCITLALDHVDTNAFPTLSNMFDESSTGNMFSDSVRQDFCFACCLHGLIEESSIETLLGDIPMQSLPTGGRYVKEDLVQQCLSDPRRAEGLIDELEHMDGNVGAVSQAITEVIGRLCGSKDTMTLKGLCSQLARKPSSLDVMLLFDKPTAILQPICDLLDNWRYDDDQGEYQPVYEEFGSILLLVLSFTHRYGLSTVDLGIRSADSFIAKLLNQGHLSRAMEDLTEQESSHLDGWIRGLFDNESGGLGDELMSSCPPQDFYLLVPTLFHHIVLACATKNLSDEGLKGGLEYLVDTFLLPSLIPGITWLSAHLWESRGDANAVLQILSALITEQRSISNNNEAAQMLNSILNIVAKNLEHSLRWLQRAEPTRQDIEPLSRALRANLGWERRAASEHTELGEWTKEGGIVTTIRNTIQHLVHWGENVNPHVGGNSPAAYTHRMVLVGVKMCGAKRILQAIVEEVKALYPQPSHSGAGVVYDVATALICAPEAESWDPTGTGGTGGMAGGGLGGPSSLGGTGGLMPLQRRLTLREALKFEVENMPKVHATGNPADSFHAETVIRLYRKVEAQGAVPILSSVVDEVMGNALASGGMVGEGLDMSGAINEGGLMGEGGMDIGDGGLGMGGGDLGLGGGGEVLDIDHGDLMSGLMGGDGGGDLLDAFEGLGDGMGF